MRASILLLGPVSLSATTLSLRTTVVLSSVVIAVATWQNYADLDGLVNREAAALRVLERGVSGYPEPAQSGPGAAEAPVRRARDGHRHQGRAEQPLRGQQRPVARQVGVEGQNQRGRDQQPDQ